MCVISFFFFFFLDLLLNCYICLQVSEGLDFSDDNARVVVSFFTLQMLGAKYSTFSVGIFCHVSTIYLLWKSQNECKSQTSRTQVNLANTLLVVLYVFNLFFFL